MTKEADPSLIDNLWYFDSVVSRKSIAKRGKGAKAKPSVGPDAVAEDGESLTGNGENQLPLSTGGERSTAGAAYASAVYGGVEEGEGGGGCGSCEGCMKSREEGESGPSMCELVDKMEEGTEELSAKELSLWMQKLGLEYTADGAMIRRVPNAEFSSQQKLDFSEFVCLNRFIEDERAPQDGHHQLQHASFSDAHMASLHEVFQLVDRDDNGLISSSELRAALAKLGLRNTLG